MKRNANYWITKLSLLPHPEGGYFKEVYRSKEKYTGTALPERFSGDRAFCTSIYYLLEGHDFSAFHRIKSDEGWHFYAGTTAVRIRIISSEGKYSSVLLGNNPENGEILQFFVPAGDWFGARPENPDGYALVGCTVSPGFDFNDFEMADTDSLLQKYPQHEKIIRELTR